MLKESKFQNLIASQNNDRKERVWENLKDNVDKKISDETVQGNGNTVAVRQKKFYLIIASAVFLLCAVALILGLTLKPDAPSGPRYCAESDYTILDANMTLDEYARLNGIELLTFGWNDEMEVYDADIFTLKDSNEIICFMETSVDERTGCLLRFAVTDNRTEIEFLKTFESADRTYQVNGLTVKWSYDISEGLATFEYNSYKYYIRLVDPIDEEDILYWVDKLIKG